MTVPAVSPSFARRASRVLLGLVALAAALAATVAALMFFWILPTIADHRDSVAALLTRAVGQRVTIEAVSGDWRQTRPEFRLQGVRLYDARNRPALHLPELSTTFAWRSLLLLEPRFSRIRLQGLTLDVRRTRDGRFYVGGVPVNPADHSSGLSNWLLRQGRVELDDATLTWRDETRAAPPLVLQAVDLTLVNVRREHRFELNATPPAALARPLSVNARLRALDDADPASWTGAVMLRLAGIDFPQLAQWFDLPQQPSRGRGALNVRFEIAAGTLTGVAAGLDLRNVDAVLAAGLPPLSLARVHGQATWRRAGGGQTVALDNLRLALPDGRLGAPFDLALAWNTGAREITARALQLNGWQTLLPSLPMDAALRDELRRLQPRGRLDTLTLRWAGAQPGLDNFTLRARFSGVGIATGGAYPGFGNLSGQIEGDAAGGRFALESTDVRLVWPALFREPELGLDLLRASGLWTTTAQGRQIKLERAVFANPDLAGTAQGHYQPVAGGPGRVDLTAQLTRVDGPTAYRYFPKKIGDHTVAWVREGVIAGRSDDVRLRLRGDLADFPFDRGGGEFRVDARVKEAVLQYLPGWPRIEDIEARLLFAGKTMRIDTTRARIGGVALAPVRAEIPDLIHHEEQLTVEGVANGPLQEFIRFANFSPVGERLRGVTDALDGNGAMRLGLKIEVPLRHSVDTRVHGRLSFLGNTLFPPGLPRLEQVRGEVDFTHASLAAENVSARLLGGPLRIDTDTRDGQVRVLAQGRATAAGLAPWLGRAWGSRLSGETAWRGQIDLDAEGERMRIESDLVGIEMRLPAPLTKPAAQPLPLVVVSDPGVAGRQQAVRLGRMVSAVWRNTGDGHFGRGEIRFGGQAVLPSEPGLRLAGSGLGFDLTGWAALLPGAGTGDGGPVTLSSIDLGFAAFDLMGRRFENVRLQGRTRNGLLRTEVSGRGMSGVLTYRPSGSAGRSEPARLSAQFSQLTIPAAAPASGLADGINMKAGDIPMLDIAVADFRLQDRPMGRLQGQAHGEPRGLVIDTLQITHPDSVFRMSGVWHDGGQSETRATLSLDVLDAARFLGRFGYPGTMRRGSAVLSGDASWRGSPADFAFATLAGQIDFKASNGQFLQVEPGAGKLLGVLSLQSLPRRLNFDFRDIFNDGFAFDDIEATLRVARGVVYSDNFRMRGPAAKVNMSGLADLNRESVQLRVKVIPKLSEGVAVAGALIGGPLAGVGALAAQKLLRDPIEEATSREYLVAGPWLSPDISRLARAESRASEP